MLCRAIGALESQNDIAGFELPIRCSGFKTKGLLLRDQARLATYSLNCADRFDERPTLERVAHAAVKPQTAATLSPALPNARELGVGRFLVSCDWTRVFSSRGAGRLV
jgi:hypothetical protein